LDQASEPTYYGITSYQMHARRKERIEELPKFVASCEPQVLSTHDRKIFPSKIIKNKLVHAISFWFPSKLIL